MPVVVGIFPSNTAIEKLTDSLKQGGLDPARLTVISGDEASGKLISSGVQFVLSGEAEETSIAGGTGIITSHGGPEVPGLSKISADVGELEELPELEALSDLNVPDGRTDDYAEALENGRAIAGYYADDTDKVKGLFTSAGATSVEVF